MSLTITQRPQQTISGQVCRWNAVAHPILYKFTSDVWQNYTNYRAEIEVYNAADNTSISDYPFDFSPDLNGLITCDISAILRGQFSPNTDADLTDNTTRTAQSNMVVEFYIKYREVWDGSANAQSSDATKTFFAVFGALQIPSTYGGNFNNYVAYEYSDESALWLTKLTQPVMWRGWPFLLTSLIDRDLTDYIDLVLTGDDGQIHHSAIGQSAGKMVDWGFSFMSDVYQDSIDTITAQIAETEYGLAYMAAKTIEMRDPCDNPVMLLGRNSLGGALMWMFDVDQEETFDYGNGIKNKRQVLKTNRLTLNQWESLQDFITLGEVYRENITEFTSSTYKTSSRIGQQLYVVASDGTKTGVIAIASRNKTMTRMRVHEFEIEIEYPETFVP